MKGLYNLNKGVLIITLLLYLTIYYGLYSQIVLGIIQVLSALALFNYWKKFSTQTKKQLFIYWTITILYGCGWQMNWINSSDTFLVILKIIILPMSIAFYFFYILNSVKNLKS
jgi:hypothetical protein